MSIVKVGLTAALAAGLLVLAAGSYFGRHDGTTIPAADPDATLETAVFAVG